MNRLTQKRVNGIKTGYWSTSKKDELVARLAEYEDTGLAPVEVLKMKQNTVQWIPVTERLPESKEKGGYMVNYLVCTEDGSVDIGNYVESVGKWFVLGIQTDVIAWMALPEAYKAVN